MDSNSLHSLKVTFPTRDSTRGVHTELITSMLFPTSDDVGLHDLGDEERLGGVLRRRR